MSIPEHIRILIDQIRESEDWWKALYMAVWGLSYQIKERYEGRDSWREKQKLGLPASKKGYQEYTPERLHFILTQRDKETALNHTITIFSLLENLSKKTALIVEQKDINMGKYKNLSDFLLRNKFLKSDEEPELRLARATRNCVNHHGNKANKWYIDSLKVARPDEEGKYKEGEDVCSSLHWLEDWHELLLKITDRIEEHLLSS